MKRLIREILLENRSLKLTAIFLALVLWLFVRGDPGAEKVITVPLEIQMPRNMEITSERPISVEVTLRGTISNMWFGQPVPTCSINLQGADEGKHVIPLTQANVRIARTSGIEVLKVTPARVTLALERTVSKEVPIVVPIRGEPALGYEIYSKSLKPASVVITGPRSDIERIGEIPTEAVSLNGQKQSIRMFLNLNVADRMVRTSVATPIEVDIEVGRRRKVVTVPNVTVTTDDSAYTTVPRQISVQLYVPVSFSESFIQTALSATVETKNLDSPQLPAKVKPGVRFTRELDPAIIIKGIQPAEVTVRRDGQ